MSSNLINVEGEDAPYTSSAEVVMVRYCKICTFCVALMDVPITLHSVELFLLSTLCHLFRSRSYPTRIPFFFYQQVPPVGRIDKIFDSKMGKLIAERERAADALEDLHR